MGQSLTLQCEVTTVRGITSRVDIVWSSNGTVMRRMNDTTASTLGNSLVYTDYHTIQMLNTSDHNRVITCDAVIVDPLVMGSGNIILDVIGEYYSYIMYVVQLYIISSLIFHI